MKSEARKKKIKYDKAYQMTQDQKDLIEGRVGARLEMLYPGYLWFIHVDKGMLQVTCPMANKKYGFQMPLTMLTTEMHEIMLAGGEILERHRLNRGRADFEAINTADRNILGDMNPDE